MLHSAESLCTRDRCASRQTVGVRQWFDGGSAGSVLGPLLAISFSFTMKWCALFLLLSMIIAAYLEQVEIHANRCNVNGDPLGASLAIRSAAAKP